MPPKYQTVFGETLLELAKQNPLIVGVTPAMPTGCSMNILKEAMPEKVFDVGIAEGHAVTFSAGMAIDGLVPFAISIALSRNGPTTISYTTWPSSGFR